MIVTRRNKAEKKAFVKFWKERLQGLKGASIRINYYSMDWAGQISTDVVLHKMRGICIRVETH